MLSSCFYLREFEFLLVCRRPLRSLLTRGADSVSGSSPARFAWACRRGFCRVLGHYPDVLIVPRMCADCLHLFVAGNVRDWGDNTSTQICSEDLCVLVFLAPLKQFSSLPSYRNTQPLYLLSRFAVDRCKFFFASCRCIRTYWFTWVLHLKNTHRVCTQRMVSVFYFMLRLKPFEEIAVL